MGQPKKFAQTTTLAGPARIEHRISRPAPQHHTVQTHVFIPVLLALAGGLIALLIGAAVVSALGWSTHIVWIIGSVTAGLILAWRIVVADTLNWEHESLPPGAPPVTLNQRPPIPLNAANARQDARQLLASRVDPAMVSFLQTCIAVGTAEEDHDVGYDGGMLRDDYLAKRDLLFKLGIARWWNEINHKRGWHLVVTYDQALEILGQYTLRPY